MQRVPLAAGSDVDAAPEGVDFDRRPRPGAAVRLCFGRHWLTLAVGVAAAAPVIASTIRGLAERWAPVGDRAIIATRAYDVLSAHTPLVGEYSDSSRVLGGVTHNLGPLLFWLLALPAHLGPAAMAVTMGVVNAGAIVAIVALARRRGGAALMIAAAIATSVMCRSLVSETYHDIWNPSAAVLPLTLLIFICWSLACGEQRLLPAAVLVASFVAQCHLALVAPSVALMAVGASGLALSRRRLAAERRPPLRRSALAALAVAAICWSAPAVEQLVQRPGNLTMVVRTALAHKGTLGTSAGWHAVVRAVGAPPWWLSVPRTPYDRLDEVRTAPGTPAVAWCSLLLCGLVVAAAAGWRRGRPDVTAAAVIGLVLCAALAAVAAATPREAVLVDTLGYTMWCGSPVGMWVWLTLGWSAVTLLRPAATLLRSAELMRSAAMLLRPARLRVPVPALALALGVATALAAGIVAAASGRADEHRFEYGPVSTIAARLDRAITRAGTVWLDGSPGVVTQPLKPAITYALRLDGRRVLGIGAAPRLGAWYELRRRGYDAAAYVYDGAQPPAARGPIVARVGLRWGADRHTISLSLAAVSRR